MNWIINFISLVIIIFLLCYCGLLSIYTLRVHYAHAAANLNSGYSKYTKVAGVHYFVQIMHLRFDFELTLRVRALDKRSLTVHERLLPCSIEWLSTRYNYRTVIQTFAYAPVVITAFLRFCTLTLPRVIRDNHAFFSTSSKVHYNKVCYLCLILTAAVVIPGNNLSTPTWWFILVKTWSSNLAFGRKTSPQSTAQKQPYLRITY